MLQAEMMREGIAIEGKKSSEMTRSTGKSLAERGREDEFRGETGRDGKDDLFV